MYLTMKKRQKKNEKNKPNGFSLSSIRIIAAHRLQGSIWKTNCLTQCPSSSVQIRDIRLVHHVSPIQDVTQGVLHQFQHLRDFGVVRKVSLQLRTGVISFWRYTQPTWKLIAFIRKMISHCTLGTHSFAELADRACIVTLVVVGNQAARWDVGIVTALVRAGVNMRNATDLVRVEVCARPAMDIAKVALDAADWTINIPQSVEDDVSRIIWHVIFE